MGKLFTKPWRALPGETFEMTEQYYISKLESIEYRKKGYKMAILGLTGTGKSSFINSVFTALDGEYSNIVNTRASTSTGRGTERVNAVRLKAHNLLHDVVFIDTKGIQTDGKGIGKDELRNVCNGEFRIQIEHARTKGWTKFKPHCVIIVIDVSQLKDLAQEKTSVVTRELQSIFDCVPGDVAITVVLSHCDKIEHDFRKIYYSQEIQKAVMAAEQITGVTREHIVPVVNYVGERCRKPDSVMNSYLLEALYYSMRAAKCRTGWRN